MRLYQTRAEERLPLRAARVNSRPCEFDSGHWRIKALVELIQRRSHFICKSTCQLLLDAMCTWVLTGVRVLHARVEQRKLHPETASFGPKRGCR